MMHTLKFAPNELQRQHQRQQATSQNNSNTHQTTATSHFDDSLPSIVRIQRKLLAFFYIYATLIVSLYMTYAIYCYYQHTNTTQRALNKQQDSAKEQAASELEDLSLEAKQSKLVDASGQRENLEQKLHLLERYIEIIALDLEETKGRLREREKCACSQRCSFNGTIFQDEQVWQQKCDTCTCSGGKISCAPRKCPKLSCANSVQLAGQCCPTCMKNCKLNKSIIKHGESIRPQLEIRGQQTKSCKCNDGLIKCETINSKPTQLGPASPLRGAHNKTMEYLKSIIATPQLVKLKVS